MTRKIFRFLFHRIKNCYFKVKVFAELFCLLPDFYKICLDDFGRMRKKDYKARYLIDKLKKVSSWHSNFQGLIDFWKLDPDFNKIFADASRVQGNFQLRCFMLYQFINQVGGLDGDVAEVGVYRGRSARVIVLAAKKFKKKVFLFDTFAGMPETDSKRDNFYEKGAFSDTSYEKVKSFFSDCKNVSIYPGFFPDTAKPIVKKKFCFVHVDVDIYQSVKDCCQFFYPRLVKGGIVVFDDPGFKDCAGAKLAVDEFFSNKEEAPIYLPSGQVLVIKSCQHGKVK